MPGKRNPSRRTTVWALSQEPELTDCLQAKYLDSGHFAMEVVRINPQPGWLGTGTIENPDIEWASVIASYPGRTRGLANHPAAALVLLSRPGRTIALSYGMGWVLLDQRKV